MTARVSVDDVADIRAAIGKVHAFVAGMTREQFLVDEKTSFAVIRALEMMGEAAKNIPVELKAQYPGLPWKEMAGLRDKLIQAYFGVDLHVVWETITHDLPAVSGISNMKPVPMVK